MQEEQGPAILLCNGSFDPITCAHIMLVEYVHAYLLETGIEVTKILFSPTHEQYPYKKLTPSVHRIAMIRLAIESSALASIMEVDTKEAEDPQGFQPTYVVVEKIVKKYNVEGIYIAAGMDLLNCQCNAQIWRPSNVERLYSLATAVVVPREGGTGKVDKQKVLRKLKAIPYLSRPYDSGRILILDEPVSTFSSSAARMELKDGFTSMCPASVSEYIHAHSLYQSV